MVSALISFNSYDFLAIQRFLLTHAHTHTYRLKMKEMDQIFYLQVCVREIECVCVCVAILLSYVEVGMPECVCGLCFQ